MSSAELLRDRHLRVTAARVAVLEVLAGRSHLTTEQVALAVRARIGTVSMQAVYHMLDSLTAAGLLRRVALGGAAVRYERRVGDNHHHAVCRSCGDVTDVDCASDERPCGTPPDPQGYQIDEAEVIFWGTCPQCLASRAVPTTTKGLS
ncbi:Fur family transcriptional regulator [Pengzhenrongella sicca]|uniref:Transcriptional repressor n=1 Tax=Pengzhenrongella sicca TaxID=2819238 RepID=A0A8A4ZJS4_9MICO|nr:Fur family transcriptional regulator [Pengzhenrongella sicca]QTE31303.1 transcriptional repressor [Pengzhenrongella sicca]